MLTESQVCDYLDISRSKLFKYKEHLPQPALYIKSATGKPSPRWEESQLDEIRTAILRSKNRPHVIKGEAAMCIFFNSGRAWML